MRLILIAALLAMTGCSASAATIDRGSAIDMQGSGLTMADWGPAGINVRAANMPGVVRK